MAWVKFISDFEFDFRPAKACCQIYRASEQPQNLPERVVAAAVAAGAGERIERPGDDLPPEETPAQQPEAKRAVRRTKKEL
jgi:hypothetical protein